MVSRLDLDGTYSPHGLVSKILEAETDLKIPVPIEQLAHSLDISEIQELQTEGFEGGLLTDEARSFGAILVRKKVNHQRRRFTIAHELGHFLIVHHRPLNDNEGFLCDRKAMRQWDIKSQNAYSKMEAEANRFAALVLMPPPHLRHLLANQKHQSLSIVLDIADRFLVSKEAAARSYTEYSENIAVLICKDGRLIRSYRSRNFPWIILKQNDLIPKISDIHKASVKGKIYISDETPAEYWIETERGKKIPKMYEQVMLQANGFAMIQLRLLDQSDDEYDPLENMTSKERFRVEQERWSKG
ncbi:ImmA/IrrE family metallo-endopeptidase [Hoeflea sp.]|uniref:ImmA/IrrE family metallo-endopeptidase n=1 Tax=Hoeflea sp. TaxID=1940281 RepID=UPI003A9514B2